MSVKFVVLAATLLAARVVPGAGLEPACDPADPVTGRQCQLARLREGERLFSEETFGGNGRTCETCHSRKTGTLSPRDVQLLLKTDPDDALFRHDGTDDGNTGTARIAEQATVRITLPLPPDVTLRNDPDATSVTFLRGVPTTMNTPALDAVLMYDRRDLSLQAQAMGAIRAHAESNDVTDVELDLIAEFQRHANRFFSRPGLRHYAAGGPAPSLPEGDTAAEKRGRRFFVDAKFEPPSRDGICALCHSGPMLNTANRFSTEVFGNPPGARDHNVLVSERNVLGLPLHTFLIHDTIEPDNPVEVTTPDLGLLMTALPKLLVQGAIPPDVVIGRQGLRRAFFANFFKTPTLWGVRRTAPYFHDNSAKTLREMVDHYEFFFRARGLPVELSEQDKQDMIAFLKLL